MAEKRKSAVPFEKLQEAQEREAARATNDARIVSLVKALARHAAREHFTNPCLDRWKNSDSEDNAKG